MGLLVTLVAVGVTGVIALSVIRRRRKRQLMADRLDRAMQTKE